MINSQFYQCGLRVIRSLLESPIVVQRTRAIVVGERNGQVSTLDNAHRSFNCVLLMKRQRRKCAGTIVIIVFFLCFNRYPTANILNSNRNPTIPFETGSVINSVIYFATFDMFFFLRRSLKGSYKSLLKYDL